MTQKKSRRNKDGIAATVVKLALSCLLVVAVAGFVTDWFGYGDVIPLPSMSSLNNDLTRSRIRKVAEQQLDALMNPESDEFVTIVTGGRVRSGKLMEQEVIHGVSYADLMRTVTKHMSYEIDSVTVDGRQAVVHATIRNGDIVSAIDDWGKAMGDRSQWPSDLREMAEEYDALPEGKDDPEKAERIEERLCEWGWRLFRDLVDERAEDLKSNDVTLTYRKMDDGTWGYAGECGVATAMLGGSELELVKSLLVRSVS